MGTNRDKRPRLMRIKPKKTLGGVCAGFGYWLGCRTGLIRLLAIAMVLGGISALPYILCWIFMPATDELPPDYDERTGSG